MNIQYKKKKEAQLNFIGVVPLKLVLKTSNPVNSGIRKFFHSLNQKYEGTTGATYGKPPQSF